MVLAGLLLAPVVLLAGGLLLLVVARGCREAAELAPDAAPTTRLSEGAGAAVGGDSACSGGALITGVSPPFCVSLEKSSRWLARLESVRASSTKQVPMTMETASVVSKCETTNLRRLDSNSLAWFVGVAVLPLVGALLAAGSPIWRGHHFI